MSYSPKTYRKAGGDEFVVASGGTLNCESGSAVTLAGTNTISGDTTFSGLVTDSNRPIVRNIRTRFTIAQVNSGATLLPAVAGFKYRMVDGAMIAVGGAAAAHTTIDILGTQSSGVKLVAFAVANTAQSAVLKPGVTGAAVLADGASYVACDANTAITVGKTGSSITTATHIDFIFSYVLEAA